MRQELVRVNYKKIYSQIAKYGVTISELAKDYGMDEKTFIERMKIGLDSKLFSSVLKANERNTKKQHRNDKEFVKATSKTSVDVNKEEEKDMARKEQNSSRKVEMVELEKKQGNINDELSKKREMLTEASEILAIREENLTETQRVFDEASKALAESKKERDGARYVVEQQKQDIEKLQDMLADFEDKITTLKNKAIYLVAPGYTGKKPTFGTYYSTVKVQGFDTLSVVEATAEYAIEPALKDMVVTGYDSYKEYMKGLRFVMLCVEYTCSDIEYTVLVNDERLKKLLKAYIE